MDTHQTRALIGLLTSNILRESPPASIIEMNGLIIAHGDFNANLIDFHENGWNGCPVESLLTAFRLYECKTSGAMDNPPDGSGTAEFMKAYRLDERRLSLWIAAIEAGTIGMNHNTVMADHQLEHVL